MTKQDIAEKLVQRGICTRSTAIKVVGCITEILAESLAKGESVYLRGFATFKVVERKQRTGYDMKDGKKVIIPARKDIKLQVSKELKDKIN